MHAAHLHQLPHRVSVDQRTDAQDSFGQRNDAWTPLLANVRGAVKQLQGRELIAAQAVRAEATYSVTVRWRQNLANATTHDLRVRYRSGGVDHVLSVKGPPLDPGQDRRYVQLLCSSGLMDNTD